jgi:hypothetical protein
MMRTIGKIARQNRRRERMIPPRPRTFMHHATAGHPHDLTVHPLPPPFAGQPPQRPPAIPSPPPIPRPPPHVPPERAVRPHVEAAVRKAGFVPGASEHVVEIDALMDAISEEQLAGGDHVGDVAAGGVLDEEISTAAAQR